MQALARWDSKRPDVLGLTTMGRQDVVKIRNRSNVHVRTQVGSFALDCAPAHVVDVPAWVAVGVRSTLILRDMFVEVDEEGFEPELLVEDAPPSSEAPRGFEPSVGVLSLGPGGLAFEPSAPPVKRGPGRPRKVRDDG